MADHYGWLRNDPWFRENTDNVPDEELDSAVERIKRDLNGTILAEVPNGDDSAQ